MTGLPAFVSYLGIRLLLATLYYDGSHCSHVSICGYGLGTNSHRVLSAHSVMGYGVGVLVMECNRFPAGLPHLGS